MAIRDIVKDSDPSLRKKSREVTSFDAKLKKLLDDMLETMVKFDGIGLASPQVGILKRIAIIRTELDEIVEFINPVFVKSEGEQMSNEGCLSVENRRGNVRRPLSVEVAAYDRNGVKFDRTFSGMDATVCCHEFDHLNGVLFYDRMLDEDNMEEDIKEEE